MKGLLWKELRENRVLAILATLILIVLFFRSGLAAINSAKLVSMEKGGSIQMLQPLIAEDFLTPLAVICGLFGTILGWMQMFTERHRDLHAYLLHRPLTPSAIFRSKVMAGLLLYTTAMGLPLGLFILWTSLPGSVAAPFELPMILPALAYLMCGIVCYFTAMLVCVRNAKWQGSRIWPTGITVFVFLASATLPHAWLVGIVIAIAITMMASAAGGSFSTSGTFEGQSGLAKASLTTSLTMGVTIISLFILAVIHNSLIASDNRTTVRYEIGRDGSVYKISVKNRRQEVTDLEGKPLLDGNGQRITSLRYPYAQAPSTSLTVNQEDEFKSHKRPFQNSNTYFRFWKGTDGVIWYDWLKYGRLVGFDSGTRKIVGSIGPDGYVNALTGKAQFSAANDYPWYPRTAFYDRTKAYLINEREKTVKSLLQTTGTNLILDARVLLTGEGPRYTAVATSSSIHLFMPDGQQLWEVPFAKKTDEYPTIQVYMLDSAGKYVVTAKPSQKLNHSQDGKMPVFYYLVSKNSGIEKTMMLPADFYDNEPMTLLRKMTLSFAPIPLLLIEESTRTLLPVAFAYSIIAAMAGMVLIWRYRLSFKTNLVWVFFLLVTGLPGLVAFVFARDWPQLVACPNCHKPRNTELQNCPCCHSPFPAPERNGMEIFETVTAE